MFTASGIAMRMRLVDTMTQSGIAACVNARRPDPSVRSKQAGSAERPFSWIGQQFSGPA